ncbi:MAG: glycosyltransferase family 39 protein [Actinomycetota bacterium]|nr:glycosyltransferase family 39 protein [Actinomycetota bacterium]
MELKETRNAQDETEGAESAEEPRREPLVRPTTLFLGAVVLLAGALQLFLIGDKSFWLDEGASFSFSRLPVGDLWDLAAGRQANMSLYYVLLHFWLEIDQGEAYIRLLSVLFSVGTVPLVYFIGQRLFSEMAGAFAAGLISINAFVVQYSQEARGYTLAMFLVTLSTYIFIRAVGQESTWMWIAYAIVSGLALYAHFFAGFVVVAHAMGLVIKQRRQITLAAIGSFVAIVAISLPLMLFVLFNDRGQIDWLDKPGPKETLDGLAELAGDGGYLLLAAYGLLIVASFVWKRPAGSWGVWLTSLWFLVPVGGSLVISLVKPLFLARYLLVAIPPLALFAGHGLTALRPAAARVVAGAVVVALAATGLHSWYFDARKEEWRPAAAYVLMNARPDDGIVLYAARMRRPFEYYVTLYEREGEAPAPVYPQGPWGAKVAPTTPPLKTSPMSRAVSDLSRVWLVLSHAGTGKGARQAVGAIKGVLSENMRLESAREFHKVQVQLYAK